MIGAGQPAHRYFRPRGLSRLCLFPWHRRLGSHVPYKSLVELRAAYLPDGWASYWQTFFMISFGSIVHSNFEMLSTIEPAAPSSRLRDVC
jgi:hypothetical protein